MWLHLLLATGAHALTVPGDHATLAEAVDAAAAGDVIELGPGAWVGSITIDRDLEIRGASRWSTAIRGSAGDQAVRVTGGARVVLRDLALEGAGRRGLAVDGGAHVTVEDALCTEGTAVNGAGACMRVVGDADLIVRNARFYGNTATGSNGGHLAAQDGARLEVRDSDLRDGVATQGGAVWVSGATLLLVDSRLGGNAATGAGGGVYAVNSPGLEVVGTWFYGNSGTQGGGLYASATSGPMTVDDSLFVRNTASSAGGGLYVQNTSGLSVQGSVFSDNTATSTGGALEWASCNACIGSDLWVESNRTTSSHGGAFRVESSNGAGFTRSMLQGNTSGQRGGAVYLNGGGDSFLRGSFVCDNSTANGQDGGGVYVQSPRFQLTTSVLMFNRAGDDGGGFDIDSSNAVALHNTLLANRSPDEGGHVRLRSGRLDLESSLLAWSPDGVAYFESGGDAFSRYNRYHANTDGNTDDVSTSNDSTGDPLLLSFSAAVADCAAHDVRPQAGSPLHGLARDGFTVGAWGGPDGDPRWYDDDDGDGFVGLLDCHDGDPDLNPDTVWYRDLDGDGFGDPAHFEIGCVPPDVGWVLDGTDCDDTDPTAFALQTVYDDLDGDGFGDPSTGRQACGTPDGTVVDGTDCDDTDPDAFPGQVWYVDGDGDGYGDASAPIEQCLPVPGAILVGGDCDDGDAAVHPGAVEVCNGVDDDCDGRSDDADPDLDLGTATTWYADADGDGYGDPGVTALACAAPDGFVADASDCDDTDASAGPPTDWWPDLDGDGYGDSAAAPFSDCPPQEGYVGNGLDCDDTDAAIHPLTVWYVDADGDGFGDVAVVGCEAPPGGVLVGGDCDDTDAAIFPGAVEVCNGVDDDCDGLIDDADPDVDLATAPTWYRDADGDGYGDPDVSVVACEAPPGYVADGTDCDDGNLFINPGAPEQCNEIDHNCNGDPEDDVVDLIWFRDADGDGWGDGADVVVDCVQPEGYVLQPGDCDDSDASVHPGALEYCNGVDDNCSGTIDDNAVDAQIWAPDADGDGFGDDALAVAVCEAPPGYTQVLGDCDDTDASVHPGAVEHCNGRDDDCNGIVDDNAVDEVPWYPDADGDGWGDIDGAPTYACDPPDGYGAAHDCDDTDPAVFPGAPERCNGIDDDCDGEIDEGLAVTWHRDADGDGYGDPSDTLEDCAQPPGYVADGTDCDDADPARYPNAPGLDARCDPTGGGGRELAPEPADGEGAGCGCNTTTPAGGVGWVVVLGALIARRRLSAADARR